MLRSPLFAKKDAEAGAAGKTGALPLPPGPGVTAVTIKELDEALADYKTKRDARCAASKEEGPAKEKVLTLFHANAEKLQDGKGTLRYKFQDEDVIVDVYIVAAKEKIKFGKSDKNADEENE
jgi:hypothetical protein